MPRRARAYDAVIAMYHDQALIPIKTLAFDRGVNVTLGLAVRAHVARSRHRVRHRRRGAASPHSLIAALKLADAVARAAARRQAVGP